MSESRKDPESQKVSEPQKVSESQKGVRSNVYPMHGGGGGDGGGGDSLVERVARIEATLPYLATSKELEEVRHGVRHDITKLKVWILSGALATIVTLMVTIIGVATIYLRLSGV